MSDTPQLPDLNADDVTGGIGPNSAPVTVSDDPRTRWGDSANQVRVKIVLERNAEIPPTGQPISINGRMYVLRPGEAAEVPEEVIEVLNNAVQSVAELDHSDKVIGYRDQLRFPYRIISVVPGEYPRAA